MSETATARPLLEKYCQSHCGIDVGAGGDPITPWAICVDREETSGSRAHVGQHPTHLVGDAADLHWFKDGSLDWLYSSHCLEDFWDTSTILKEWLRVIKPGGYLVLFLPDQKIYEEDCQKNASLPNQAHKHRDFSLDFVVKILSELNIMPDQMDATFPFPGNPYSFSLVVKKREA